MFGKIVNYFIYNLKSCVYRAGRRHAALERRPGNAAKLIFPSASRLIYAGDIQGEFQYPSDSKEAQKCPVPTHSISRRLERKAKRQRKRRAKREVRNQRFSTAPFQMSDVLIELTGPFFPDERSLEMDEPLLWQAAGAWNALQLPIESRQEWIHDFHRRRLRASVSLDDFQQFCEAFAKRKLRFYPLVDFGIFDLHFSELPEGDVYFDVLFSPAMEDPEW
jgi:hypothetical protein